MRAVGFFRSPDTASDHVTGASDPATEIQRYCERNYHQLVNTFSIDDESSAEKAFSTITQSFRDGRPALVVIPDASHLAPDLETFVRRMIEIVDAGGELRCTDVDRPDPLQSAEELLSLKGRSVARQRRVREAIMAKASRGQVLGRTPYGYTSGSDGQLQEQPDEAETVRQIFEWYAGPQVSDGVIPKGGIGLRLIAQRLNDNGSRTRQGHPWTQVAVAGLLHNRVYLGTYSRYGVRIVGSHPPIVRRDLFNRAEAVTEQRRPVRKRRNAEPFLLSGLVRSEVSGRGLFGLTRRRSWKRQDGSPMEKTYRYYECPHKEPAPNNGDLIKLSWNAEKLERAVREKISAWSSKRFEGAVIATDPDSPSHEDNVRMAEREFTRSVRAVANGYGNIHDLKEPLTALSAARNVEQTPDTKEMDAAEVREAALSDDLLVARSAILAVVERITVGPRKICVIPKLGSC